MSDEEGDDDWFESAVEGDADTESSESDAARSGDGEDSPFEDSGDGPFGDTDADPFGGASDDDPFGASDDDSGGLFDDDFASAFDSASGPDGGGSDGEFEDEDLDSDIPRIDVGIDGLDRMIQGGIPERHLIVTVGSAGTGKTTFGLQFLHHGLERGENCVFITLEQSHSAIMDTANDRGWDFDEYEANDQLAVVDLDPVEMANSLDNIRGELPDLVEDFDADRLVLDSVSLLEMMYDNPAKRRTEVFDFTRSLKAAGVTTMLTSEASEDNPYASRHGIIEYLTDAVFVLQYVRSETRETRLAVEIQKIRNANHSRETKPYEITMDGISVYQQANIF
ncbi:KaiC domain-containing protein [Haloarcula nitratireducens]|uniref:KaiC domain-containing protein n=1 Tax=Haloarcula nitratireducens TaxID=2487749 RepID=A0AAW4PAT7_9EURY|nr:KaiC domain-containing protein [Halomicroarcula nitratireducens]MBX0295005.1 KaiC domain-containing protein [Halomicroarcula nitratireducens]